MEVSFEQGSYTVAEGSSVTVKVKLDADPERTVTIPLTKEGQDGATSADYSGVPGQRRVQPRGHREDLRLQRRLRQRQRRRGERQAGLWQHPAHWSQRRQHRRGDRLDHGRRCALCGGELRAGVLHGGRGEQRNGEGKAGRGPGADGDHPADQGGPGRGHERRLLRGAGQRRVQPWGHREDLRLQRRLRQRQRRRGERQAGLWQHPAHWSQRRQHRRGDRLDHGRRRALCGGELRAGVLHGGGGEHASR